MNAGDRVRLRLGDEVDDGQLGIVLEPATNPADAPYEWVVLLDGDDTGLLYMEHELEVLP